jgi:cytochrome b-561
MSFSLPQYSMIFSRLLSILAICLTILWANNDDIENKFLGGLNWQELAFNWHPILMISGFGFCLPMGLMQYRFPLFDHQINKYTHIIWYVLAIILAGIGLKAVWKSHDDIESGGLKSNLYSLHSWIGICTLVLFSQNFILGFVHFLNPSLALRIKASYKPYHLFFGLCTFVSAIFAIETGIMEKNTFTGCGYIVTEVDSNPASNYELIPQGCRVSNWIGVTMLIVLILTIFGLNFDSKSNTKMDNELEEPLTI